MIKIILKELNSCPLTAPHLLSNWQNASQRATKPGNESTNWLIDSKTKECPLPLLTSLMNLKKSIFRLSIKWSSNIGFLLNK